MGDPGSGSNRNISGKGNSAKRLIPLCLQILWSRKHSAPSDDFSRHLDELGPGGHLRDSRSMREIALCRLPAATLLLEFVKEPCFLPLPRFRHCVFVF